MYTKEYVTIGHSKAKKYNFNTIFHLKSTKVNGGQEIEAISAPTSVLNFFFVDILFPLNLTKQKYIMKCQLTLSSIQIKVQIEKRGFPTSNE